MKTHFKTSALLIALAAQCVAPVSAQSDEMIAWNFVQTESEHPVAKEVRSVKKTFLDNHLNKTSIAEANYYQIIQPFGNDQVLIKTYFATGELKMTGMAKQVDEPILHGQFVFYYQNGKVESRGKYSNGIKDGIWERFAPNGEKKAERVYTGIPVWQYFETLVYKVN
jgi:antitoxin component YwqK of YwqJK toxin-antitoxin module